jgi:hypothetical protein
MVVEEHSSLRKASLDRHGSYDTTPATANCPTTCGNATTMAKIYTAQLVKLQARFPHQNIPNRRQQVITRSDGAASMVDDVTTAAGA